MSEHVMVNMELPVTLNTSTSGKTYYARIGINGDYYTGESMVSHKDAIENLKTIIAENHSKISTFGEKTKMDLSVQYYKDIPLMQINRNYEGNKARRFAINGTNQNIWIPCVFLTKEGTIKKNVNLSFIFEAPNNINILRIAGVTRSKSGKYIIQDMSKSKVV